MLGNGIRLATNGRWHMASTHTDEEIARTITAAEKSLRAM
jgi:glutamate-1-semialdehyde aminotransferase